MNADPIAVFNAALAAFRAADWQAVIDLCDPAGLALFRREMLASVQPPAHVVTVDDLLRQDPDMPLAVAEYEVARTARYFDPSVVLDELPDVADVAMLESLGSAEVFTAWLRGQTLPCTMERAWRHAGLQGDALEAARHALQAAAEHPWPNSVAIGAVPHGRLCYVLFYPYADADAQDEDPEDAPDEDPSAAGWLAKLTPAERAIHRDASRLPQIEPLLMQPDGTWRLLPSRSFLGLSGVFYFEPSNNG